MIRMTSTEPIITCSCTAPIERSMNLALSSSSVSLTPGTSRLMRSISARTPSAICTVLVPDCFVHLHADAGLAVDAQDRPDVLGRVPDLGDVAAGRPARRSRVMHDEVADLVEVLRTGPGCAAGGAVALVDLAERDVLVLGAQDVDDAIDRQVERGDLLARQLDVNLPAQAAVDGDRGDAGDALEARRQLVLGDLAQRRRGRSCLAFDADAHDRHASSSRT